MFNHSQVWKNKPIILFTIGFFFLMVALVYMCTRSFFIELVDFQKTGVIGDTFGGITAPVINLLGAVLVYISFKAQIKANKQQYESFEMQLEISSQERNYEIILDLFKQIKDDLLSLTYNATVGKYAIHLFVEDLKQKSQETGFDADAHLKNTVYLEYMYILHCYWQIILVLEKDNVKSSDKQLLMSIIHIFYNSKLDYHCSAIIDFLSQFPIRKSDYQLLITIHSYHEMISEQFDGYSYKIS